MWSKQNTLTVNKSTKKNNCLTSKKLPPQWNQILSGVVCVVGFLLIFIFMLIFTLQEHYEAVAIRVSDVNAPKMKKCTQNLKNDCSIDCSGLLHNDNISKEVEEAFKELDKVICGQKIQKLQFQLLNVPFNELRQGWLESFTFSVGEMRIQSSTITNVVSGAFRGKIFEDLDDLTLQDLSINTFDNSTLIGLSVRVFSLWAIKFRQIRENALEPIAFSLQTFQIHQILERLDVVNITGTVKLPNLSLVDMRFNALDDTLNSDSFKGIYNVISLYLDQCHITRIGAGTFAFLPNLEIISITQNPLQTLHPNVFSGVLRHDLKLHLNGQSWHCDCNLLWLQDFEHLTDTPVCNTPEDLKDELVVEANLCEGGPPSTPQAENVTETNPTTPNDNIVLTCMVQSIHYEVLNVRRHLLSTNNFHRTQRENFELPKQSVNFDITDDEVDGTVLIDVHSNPNPNDLLIWFTKNIDLSEVLNKSIGCLTGLSDQVVINNLVFGETYSFCFIQESEQTISPFNCRAHIVVKPWKMQTWLSNEEKPIILGIVGLALFLCCIIGALMVYILIRRNPSLLRGSKRVVMVKHKEANAIILPSNFNEKCEKKTPNQMTEFKYRASPRRQSLRRTPFRRSVSETSIASARSIDVSYVSAAEPTTIQLLNWRLERLRNKMGNENVIREAPYGPPLPVPAPHTADRPSSPSLGVIDYDNFSGITEV